MLFRSGEGGDERASYILGKLASKLTESGTIPNYNLTTPFRNSIPVSEEAKMPGDLFICKDVLEHIDEITIPDVLEKFLRKSKQFFFTIPLGDNDRFRIREYEVDITHVTKKDEEWWIWQEESILFSLMMMILFTHRIWKFVLKF